MAKPGESRALRVLLESFKLQAESINLGLLNNALCLLCKAMQYLMKNTENKKYDFANQMVIYVL